MQKKVFEFIQEHQMLQEQDRVVVGVSGGADSVCLFHILLEVQKKIPFQIGVVHVNHNLRGQEACADEEFVAALCRKHQIVYEVFSFDVEKIAKEERLTVEEAGRKVRYEAFRVFSEKWQGTKTALAHHKNDLAETMVHNLARGSGLAGLCSMHPVRNQYIRPLLCMNRAEVEQYLKVRQIFWRTDSTNLDDHYMRNRIRHQVVEYLEREVNPRTVEHMANTAESIYEAEMYLNAQAEAKAEQYLQRQNEQVYVSATLLQEPPLIQKYILRDCFAHISGSRKDLGREHLEMMRRLLSKGVGRSVDLPEGISARKTYQGLIIAREKNITASNKVYTPLIIPGSIQGEGFELECRILDGDQKIIPEKRYTKWLDYDRIDSNLVLRTRRTGDYICINKSGGTKKIKEYFIDVKIPKDKRDDILLLADGAEILWIIGYRISEKYKVRQQESKRILSVQIRGRNIHE